MRTNHSNVTEVAHIRTDLDKYYNNYDSIDWGKTKKGNDGNDEDEDEMIIKWINNQISILKSQVDNWSELLANGLSDETRKLVVMQMNIDNARRRLLDSFK